MTEPIVALVFSVKSGVLESETIKALLVKVVLKSLLSFE